LNNPLWGFSIALSWTWGLGLFFSVQMAIQFGLAGLLAFAIPNAIGLAAFGWVAHSIAKNHEGGREFEKHFLNTVGELRWIFLVYQITAISITFFALFKYVFVPLNWNYGMVALIVLGAGLLLGESFGIRQLKWSHFGMSMIIILCMVAIGGGGASYFSAQNRLPVPLTGEESILSLRFLGFFVPIMVGFLLGPWLDIQQWQRAIQIHREGSNVRISYLFGGALFFGILLFHGTLALSLWSEARQLGILEKVTQASYDGLFHAKDAVIRFLFLADLETPLLFRFSYILFLVLAIISTLDSGYVALRWFQTDALKKSESVLLTLIPPSFLESPIPPFLIACLVAMAGIPLRWELEYFMSFYGSFCVGYALVFLFRTTFLPQFASFTQTTLVGLAFGSIGVFGLGYFGDLWLLMALGALIPIIHASVVIATRKAYEDISKTGVLENITNPEMLRKFSAGDYKGAMESIPGELKSMQTKLMQGKEGRRIAAEAVEAAAEVKAQADRDSAAEQGIEEPSTAEEQQPEAGAAGTLVYSHLPEGAKLVDPAGSTWLEKKWFVYTFMPTYQDTNSVGNVYFAQYGMWVGKTRELFFNYALPNFDLETTDWYVLTRSYEHKFLHETKEFNKTTVKIRICNVNRKFVTMEHEIFDSTQKMLGKGKQVLLFVRASDYGIIDIPKDCYKAFLPYL
jgi:acyl-CoA thioesterase FadM